MVYNLCVNIWRKFNTKFEAKLLAFHAFTCRLQLVESLFHRHFVDHPRFYVLLMYSRVYFKQTVGLCKGRLQLVLASQKQIYMCLVYWCLQDTYVIYRPVFRNSKLAQTESQWIAINVYSRCDIVILWCHLQGDGCLQTPIISD